ncbi:hypothetical protein POX_b02229 [Penicillium oxalicum]|uniref:hypothetical protein n=1 Tax=Penicillium oxalicum TaxID=69781 RepID=UPI0020B799BE|nr:hypothetical protein POX_b02229 [Penicillium oxalicum]KAI2792192.1 hypothetical protein POX_b02229 [Penicillium oxalicum]
MYVRTGGVLTGQRALDRGGRQEKHTTDKSSSCRSEQVKRNSTSRWHTNEYDRRLLATEAYTWDTSQLVFESTGTLRQYSQVRLANLHNTNRKRREQQS